MDRAEAEQVMLEVLTDTDVRRVIEGVGGDVHGMRRVDKECC